MTFPVYQGDPWITSKDVSRSKRVKNIFLIDIAEENSISTQNY